MIPLLAGGLLVAAALLKGHDAANRWMDGSTLMESRGFILSLVLMEFTIGSWLLSGLHPGSARIVALITFIALCEGSFYYTLLNAPTCGCLGRIATPPWVSMLVDVMMVLLLILWQPQVDVTITHAGWFRGAWLGSCLVFAGVAAWSIADYYPRSPQNQLRHDRALQASAAVKSKHITIDDLLNTMNRATSLTLTMTDRIRHGFTDLGAFQSERVRVWGLMEWLVEKHSRPVRWTKTDQGYELIRAAPLGTLMPWITPGLALLLLLIAQWRWSSSVLGSSVTHSLTSSLAVRKGVTHD